MSSDRRISPVCLTAVDAPNAVSRELLRACAHFCVIPSHRHGHEPIAPNIDPTILDRVRAPGIVQIVGPSGAGKSTLIRALIRALPKQRLRIVHESLSERQRHTASFDLLSGDAAERAAILTHAGLGEPRLWALPAGWLSVGEQARLRLAMAMQDTRAGDVVIADEFASHVDRACAYALCRTTTRWAKRLGVTLIAASAHEDLESMLAPDTVIDAGTARVRPPRAPMPQTITIEAGTIDDYQQLAHLHYRSGKPAAVVRILRAMRKVPANIDPSNRLLAGVLLVSMPTLNGVWRQRAWPGHFGTRDKSINAHRLNAQVRTISRVIVEPRSRGLGIATRLVHAYLDAPLTPGTEALAAMGSVCPFLERAGMTPYEMVPDRPDTRLLDALIYLSIAPETLMHARVEPGSMLMRELVTWGKARKLLRAGQPSLEEIQRLTPIAACRLCTRPRAYAFTKGDWGDEPQNT
ncbi:MAG: hypothetical protein CMJ35_03455 [Phycisphaerae bacterium]|nr:hypothetical protein [Phycisphaerae bacterium]MBM90655.1 hypothetical protein [Phycisphaerae bacterium]